jgi:hypothetical protein
MSLRQVCEAVNSTADVNIQIIYKIRRCDSAEVTLTFILSAGLIVRNTRFKINGVHPCLDNRTAENS